MQTDYFDFQETLSKSTDCKWLYSLLLKKTIKINRDDLLMKLKNFGIESRPVFYPMDQMPAFKNLAILKPNPVSEEISKRGFSLPSSVSLEKDDIKYICNSLISIIKSRL